MALAMKCKKGHSYVQGDIYPDDWPEGMPHCPECAKEWQKEQDAKLEITISDLQRVCLLPGDVLLARIQDKQSAQDQIRLHSLLSLAFPDNKVLVLSDIELSIIRGND